MRHTRSVTSRIRRHMNSLPEGAMFTTRELLCYRLKRASLDQALWRMVKNREVQRLALGIFRKYSRVKHPSPSEIAKVKAKVFKKEITVHGADAAHQLDLIPEGNDFSTFATDGRTSSYGTISGRVHMKQVSPRKLFLGDSPIGLLIRAVTFIGRNSIDWHGLDTSLSRNPRFGRQEHQQLYKSAYLLPAWASDILCSR